MINGKGDYIHTPQLLAMSIHIKKMCLRWGVTYHVIRTPSHPDMDPLTWGVWIMEVVLYVSFSQFCIVLFLLSYVYAQVLVFILYLLYPSFTQCPCALIYYYSRYMGSDAEVILHPLLAIICPLAYFCHCFFSLVMCIPWYVTIFTHIHVTHSPLIVMYLPIQMFRGSVTHLL